MVRRLALGMLCSLVLAASLSSAVQRDGRGVGDYVVVLKDGADVAAVAAEHARVHGARISARYVHALRGYAARIAAPARDAIEEDHRVLFVSADRKLAPTAQTLPTGVDRIDGELSTARSGDGSGIVNVNVAVIDIGIQADHPELNVQKGKNCSAPGTPYNPWHGTAVAGTIAARDDSAGVVGMAPGAKLYPVRVTDYFAKAPFSDVICAVDWVTSTRRDKNRSNDIAVVNMSLIGTGSDDGDCGRTNADALHLALCNSVAAGVTYVVAAGNTSEDFQSWVPAAYDEVLTVTAVSDSDGKPGQLGAPATCRVPAQPDEFYASFSNFATLVADQAHTIAAPGVCILTTAISGTYATYSGTSLATPHVAGTAALCIARGICSGSPAQIVQRLRSDAAAYNTSDIFYGFWGDPLRPIPERYYGYLIRAAAY